MVRHVLLALVVVMSPLWSPETSPWVGSGGTGGGAEPGPGADGESFALAGNRNGGYNPYVNSALQHGGIVYFGWVDGLGNVEAATYTEATETTSSQFTIHSGFETDAHSPPALERRASDGKFVAVYSRHNSTPINVRVSNSANSVNGWTSATNLDSQLGGTRYTNPSLHEFDGDLYLFYRDEPSAGTDSRWCISTTSSSTPTSGWAAQTIVYRVAGTRSYVKTGFDPDAGILHIVASNGSSDDYDSLGHAYLDIAAGTWHDSDGTPLTLPLDFSDLTPVYSGNLNAFAANVSIDGSGNPVVLGQDSIGGDIRVMYHRYDGAAWSSTNIASTGTGYEYSGTGTGFTAWGHAVDLGDPDIVWVLRDTGGSANLYRYDTADGGDTFTETQITDDHTTTHTQIVPVRNPDKLRAMWQGPGTWTTYTTWNQTASAVRIP